MLFRFNFIECNQGVRQGENLIMLINGLKMVSCLINDKLQTNDDVICLS